MKLNKASSTEGSQKQPPVDDASFSQDPNMMNNNHSMMNGDPNAIGGDPNAIGGDPNAIGGDPNAMGDDPNATGDDPNAMGEDPNAMGGDPNAMGGEENGASDDDTMSIINQLDDEDREAVRSYAESMLNKSDEKGEEAGQETGDETMMESVIFTKKQLNKIQENFGPSQDELMAKKDKKSLPQKQSQIKNSPFNPPSFS